MQTFNVPRTKKKKKVLKIRVTFNLKRQGNILKGSNVKMRKDRTIKYTKKITN